MGNLVVSDNAATTLAAALTNSPAVTSLTLTNGAKFPTVNHGGTGSDWSYISLFDGAGNLETMKVTRHDAGSNSFTVVRGTAAGISGQNDAGCKAWASGTTGAACRLIAQTVMDFYSALQAASTAAALAANDAAAAVAAATAAEEAAVAAAGSSPWMAVTGGIRYTGGKVGIGATPTYDFHIQKDAVNATTWVAAKNGTATGGLGVGFIGIAGAGGAYFALTESADGNTVLTNAANGSLSFGTNNTIRYTITSDGVLQDAGGNELGYRDIPPVPSSTAVQLSAAHRGKSIDTASQVTVPANATAAIPVGATITVTNTGSSALTIVQASGVTLRQAGTTNTGNRTLAGYGQATLRKVATDTWYITGSGLS